MPSTGLSTLPLMTIPPNLNKADLGALPSTTSVVEKKYIKLSLNDFNAKAVAILAPITINAIKIKRCFLAGFIAIFFVSLRL